MASPPQLPLADDLFLTAHDTVRGKCLLSPATLGLGLSAALLAELVLWRRLDVVLAHHGLLAQLWNRPDDQESILIAHGVEEALTLAAERRGVALLLRAPSPADVAAVARAGARMPRKSTLFVPKPRTGLVLRPLAG